MTNEYTKSDIELIAFRAGKAITKSQLYQELKEAEQEIENGDYMTIEDFEKESSQWK
jgi:phage anti-repressor protein